MNQLKSFLNMPEDQRKFVKTAGVPLDSTNKQLIDWISSSLEINPQYKLAIKGDANTNYPKVKNLFEGLRARRENKSKRYSSFNSIKCL